MSSFQQYATGKDVSPSRLKSKNARKDSDESRGKRIQGKRLREEGNDEDVWKPIFSNANVFVNKRKKSDSKNDYKPRVQRWHGSRGLVCGWDQKSPQAWAGWFVQPW